MAKALRNDIWRHNGRRGTVKMFQGGLTDMLSSSVCTTQTKELAKQLQPLVEELYESLKKRADHPVDKEVSSAKVE